MAAVVIVFLLAFVAGCQAQSSGYNFVCQSIDSIVCATSSQVPVCATNGVLYPSECEYIKAHCKDVNLDVAISQSSCQTTTPSSIITTTSMVDMNMTTPMVDMNMTTSMVDMNMTTSMVDMNMTTPMVDMNMTTHMVDMNMTTTIAPMTTTITLSVLCQIVVNTNCSATDNSTVCGDNYQEYGSICEFTKAQCYDPSIQVLNSGPCPSTTTATMTVSPVYDVICSFILGSTCDDDGVVVCGTDHSTYNSTCDFEKSKCLNGTLSILSVGPC